MGPLDPTRSSRGLRSGRVHRRRRRRLSAVELCRRTRTRGAGRGCVGMLVSLLLTQRGARGELVAWMSFCNFEGNGPSPEW